MVSAVFHSPLEAVAEAKAAAASRSNASAIASPAAAEAKPSLPAVSRTPIDWREWLLKVVPPIAGIGVLVGIWALLTIKSTTFPSPAETFAEALKVFADPFYSKGPNDQGIGWNILFSLKRVAIGFGMAAARPCC